MCLAVQLAPCVWYVEHATK